MLSTYIAYNDINMECLCGDNIVMPLCTNNTVPFYSLCDFAFRSINLVDSSLLRYDKFREEKTRIVYNTGISAVAKSEIEGMGGERGEVDYADCVI